jgi:hypothetical protein
MNIEYIDLCKKTVEYLSTKEKMSAKDKKFLMDLHQSIFKVEQTDLDKVIADILEISRMTIKKPSR